MPPHPTDRRVWTWDGKRPLEDFGILRDAAYRVRLRAELGDWQFSRSVPLDLDIGQPTYGAAPVTGREVKIVTLVAGLDLTSMIPHERTIYARFATEEDQRAFADWLFRR